MSPHRFQFWKSLEDRRCDICQGIYNYNYVHKSMMIVSGDYALKVLASRQMDVEKPAAAAADEQVVLVYARLASGGGDRV